MFLSSVLTMFHGCSTLQPLHLVVMASTDTVSCGISKDYQGIRGREGEERVGWV
jgi:hypothetical protein